MGLGLGHLPKVGRKAGSELRDLVSQRLRLANRPRPGKLGAGMGSSWLFTRGCPQAKCALWLAGCRAWRSHYAGQGAPLVRPSVGQGQLPHPPPQHLFEGWRVGEEGMAGKLGALALTQGDVRSPRSRNPCCLAAGVPRSPCTHTSSVHRPRVTNHPTSRLGDPVTPTAPPTLGRALAIPPSRAPEPGPNGFRRPWGTERRGARSLG